MPNVKISDMTAGTTLDGTEQFESVQSSNTRALTASQIRTFTNRKVYTYNVPIAGFSLTVSDQTQYLVLNPAGTLATGTVTFPANPLDGDTLRIHTTQEITALTLSGNGKTINGAVSTLAANGWVEYLYQSSGTTWFRIGS